MRRKMMVSMVVGVLAVAVPAIAQEGEMPQMTPEQQAEMEAYIQAGAIGPQHEAMAKEVGTYDVVVKSWMDPSAPPMVSEAVAIRTLELDGRVLHEEFQGDMMGTPFTGVSRSGYDNVSGKHWSTWTDSMSTGIMFSEGTCPDAGVCTYHGSWNDPIEKGPVQARYEMRQTSPTTQVMEMYRILPDGSDMKMMELIYTRRK